MYQQNEMKRPLNILVAFHGRFCLSEGTFFFTQKVHTWTLCV